MITVGITTSSYGKASNKVWEIPRVTMGNTSGFSADHISMDNPLILLVGSGSSCQYVGKIKTPTR